MGTVYLAADRLTGEEVALKRIHLDRFGDLEGEQSDARLLLAHEFQTLSSLRHPHIISVLDYGFDRDHRPFYTMTYLPEKKNILAAGDGLSLNDKAVLIRQMLQALAYLHRRKIFHRDIKPDNVLVYEGRLRLLDFGLSAVRSNQPTGSSGGTLAYWPPELWLGEPYTEAADMFAAGVIAFKLLTGRHPFAPVDSFLMDRVLDDEPNWDDLNGPINFFKPFFTNLLAKSPAKRYQNVREAIYALNQAVDSDVDVEEAVEIRESYLQAATFVGRKAEMSRLIGALEHTNSSAGKVWLIGGESGVGKSRLLDELRSHALVGGWQVLEGQVVSDVSLPYQLWQEIVPKLVLNQPLDDLAAGVLRQIVPSIAPLVAKDLPAPPELQGAAYKQRVTQTLVSLLQQQSVPTLLLLEDMQWAVESIEPIKQLLKVAETLPKLVVIGTFRNDEQPDLPAQLPGSQLLELNRLPNDQIGELCQNILGNEVATSKIIELLVKQTEGNTFFIVEVVRALAEEAGYLANISDRDLPSDVLTIGMQTLLQRRIERVPLADRALLHLAAVAGRALDLTLLNTLAAETKSLLLENWLQRVSDAAVISIHDNGWRFSHDKLRETILHQLDHEVFVAAHRQVAETLEQLYPGRSELHGSLLDHWHHIGDFDKEYFYLESVVDRLIRLTADYRSAASLIERGLSKLPDGDDRQVPLWNWLSSTSWRQGDYENARLFGEKALVRAKAIKDQLGIATSLRELGTVAHQQGDYEIADQHYQDALSIWIQLEDKEEKARIYSLIGSLKGAQGEFSKAKEFLKRSLMIRQENQDRYYMASVLTNLGMVAFFQEEYEDAQRLYQQSLSLSREIDDLFGIALNLNNLGSVQYHQGAFADARATYEESLAIYRKMGQQNGVIMCLINLGFVYLRQENKAARSMLYEALIGAQQANIKPFVMELIVGLAWYHFQQEELDITWQLIELAQAEAGQYVDVQIRLDELLPLLDHVSPTSYFEETGVSRTGFELDALVNNLIQLYQG